ncbi:MAG: glycosyltransferase family 2 protein [Phycisphaerales bacterium]|nr:glycosyltransferase family 2 protein [Phycisphaerales bacterium]
MHQSLPPTIPSSAPGVTVVVPCYNEQGAVTETVRQVDDALSRLECESEMIFVNDGSRDGTGAILDGLVREYPRLRVYHNPVNAGYGATLKRGVAQARFDRIVITDADGTYPNERIPDLVAMLDEHDMVVGARTGSAVRIPLARRPAKWALLRYARWMSRADIKDINSGLRAIRRIHVERYWSMLPNAFSFTTTITLALHTDGASVAYVPIDYHPRVGKSSIRPIRDTLGFFSLVFRTVMYFKPLPVFGSVAVALMVLAVVVGVIGKIRFGTVPNVSTTGLLSTGLILFGLGLIGDLINARMVGSPAHVRLRAGHDGDGRSGAPAQPRADTAAPQIEVRPLRRVPAGTSTEGGRPD